MNLTNQRVIDMEVKEGKDLLILFGQWMFIKSKTDTFKSINQHFII